MCGVTPLQTAKCKLEANERRMRDPVIMSQRLHSVMLRSALGRAGTTAEKGITQPKLFTNTATEASQVLFKLSPYSQNSLPVSKLAVRRQNFCRRVTDSSLPFSLAPNMAAKGQLGQVNIEKEEATDLYEELAAQTAANRRNENAYEDLAANPGASIRNRGSTDGWLDIIDRNVHLVNNNIRNVTAELHTVRKDTLATGRSVKDSEARIVAQLAELEENVVERIASKILAKLPELPTVEPVKQLQGRMDSGFTASQAELKKVLDAIPGLSTAVSIKELKEHTTSGFAESRKGSRNMMNTLKGMSTVGNAHIRAIELHAAQNDALRESHQNITESNIKLAETTRLQAQAVATGAQFISVSAAHYRQMKDDNSALRNDLHSRDAEVHALKRRIQELEDDARRTRIRLTAPTPQVPPGTQEEEEEQQSTGGVLPPPADDEEEESELDPQVYGDLLQIKAWDGVNLMDFKDLSPEVQASMLEWSGKVDPGWFGRVPGRKKSCAARGMSTNACLLPPDDMNVACGNCVGGKTFCVRRWSPTDSTATVFAMDSRDVQREGGVGDVSFWRNTKVGKTRPSKGMYTMKLQ
jgi:hypothetical protein